MLLPVKPAWTSMLPVAARVPVLTTPPARLRVPATFRVSPAAIVFVPDRKDALFRAMLVGTSIVTLPVENATVPLLCAKDPPLIVNAPVTVSVAAVLLKVAPGLSVNDPTEMAVVPPANDPADWLYEDVTVRLTPGIWVIVPP